MRNILTWSALVLLLASSSTALYGGFHLMMYPDGHSIKLPMELLKQTPFKNFRVPGILLFTTIGLFGLWTIFLTIYQQPYHEKYIIAAGLMLTMWILSQMALSPEIFGIQYVMLSIGIAQVLCGLSLDKNFINRGKKNNVG